MGISMAMFVMAMQIGNGLGPMMFGGIVDFGGIESAFYSGCVILLLGIAAFIGSIIKPLLKTAGLG